MEALGGLDVLVNNAGISGPTASVEEVDPDKWEEVIVVDAVGTFNVTRLAIPHLKKSSAGSIIIIMSSLGGRFGYPNRSPYNIAKVGLIGFAKMLSIELGDNNIRANAIVPGAVGGQRIENVLAGRAKVEAKSVEDGTRVDAQHPNAKAVCGPEGHRIWSYITTGYTPELVTYTGLNIRDWDNARCGCF